MNIINGVELANQILASSQVIVTSLITKPRLMIILIGDNSASKTYVNKKIEAGQKIGVEVILHEYPSATTEEILTLIKNLNRDDQVSGIILQLPAPNIDEKIVCASIEPMKDVDGLNPLSLGKLWLNQKDLIIPATPKAVIYVLEYIANKNSQTFSEYITGKNVLLINRSTIIGKPLAAILLNHNATITIAHSYTKNLEDLISKADIIISGTGKYEFIKSQKLKHGVILIDAGFTKNGRKIHGDLAREINSEQIAWLTPVPGGIGPIGVACLIENTVQAAQSREI